MPGPTNKHEQIVKELFAKSLSAPLLFHPDRFGTNAKEVCDLAFARNDVVILIEMADQESETDDIEKNERIVVKKIAHNLSHLKGALKGWKHGRILVGSNEAGQFSIPYSSDLRIALISAIRCRAGFGILHKEFAETSGVALCATIPHSVLEFLCNEGCTAVDIIKFAKSLQSTPVSEAELLGIAKYVIGTYQDKADLRKFWPLTLGSDYHRIAMSIMFSHGSYAAIPGHENESPRHFRTFSLTADLSIGDVYRLVASVMRLCIASQASDAPLNEVICLRGYDFAISIVPDLTLEWAQSAGTFADSFFSETRENAHGPHVLACARALSRVSARQYVDNLKEFSKGRRSNGLYVAWYTIPAASANADFPQFAFAAVSHPPSQPPRNLYGLLATAIE